MGRRLGGTGVSEVTQGHSGHVWWCMPVVLSTLEAEAGASLDLRSLNVGTTAFEVPIIRNKTLT